MTDAPSTPPSPLARAAASFLAQALELPDSPDAIAGELTTVKEEPSTAIYSLELDSSIGSAAFLVYLYVLPEADAQGTTGAEQFERSMTTLQRAADRDTPGPRMVAHAQSDSMAFILATTPATWRALQGQETPGIIATEADLPTATISPEQRASIAEDLHRTLKDANDHAKAWLAALRASGERADADEVEFTEEETALALFVLDNANVQPMLTALNLLVSSAQDQAGRVAGTKPSASNGSPAGDR